MRVLHVIDSLGAGGAERSLAELLPELRDRGLECEVAILSESAEGSRSTVERAGFPVHLVPGNGRLAQLRELRRLVVRRRPSLVHTTLFESDVLGRLAVWGLNIPVVSSLVNTSYDASRERDPNVPRWRLRAAQWVDAYTARQLSSGFHAITHSVKKDSVERLRIKPDRITVIPRSRSRDRLGVPSPERRQEVRAALGLSENHFVVLGIGRQEFQKGQSTLLAAFATVREHVPDTILLIAGRPGNASNDLAAAHTRLNLKASARFLGHVENVPDLLAASDVLAFPSRFEGMGGSVIEAFALGVPVVASDIPALRELLDGGRLGQLVPVDDAHALARSLITVIEDPDLVLSRAARASAQFEKEFNTSTIGDRMADWLVVNSRATRSPNR